MTNKHVLGLTLSAVLLHGCVSFNSLADAKNGKGTGESKTFSSEKSVVWQQTLGVINDSDLKLVDENESTGIILAQQPVAPFSLTAGQNVAIFVTEAGNRTRVEVVNKKAMGEIEFLSRDWDTYILEKLSERLK